MRWNILLLCFLLCCGGVVAFMRLYLLGREESPQATREAEAREKLAFPVPRRSYSQREAHPVRCCHR